MIASRRGFLGLGVAFVAAPAIVRVSNIMAVKPLPFSTDIMDLRVIIKPTQLIVPKALDARAFRLLVEPRLRAAFEEAYREAAL